MAGNTFGKVFTLTTFGESHGPAIGGVIDGCPSGLQIDFAEIDRQMNRRRPGQSKITTSRNEDDHYQVLSGVYEGITTGTPIGFLIPNKDQKPQDYEKLKDIFRPSHADFTYEEKYGIHDHRGGGRSSARETAARVFAGSIAAQLLAQQNIRINAFVSRVGTISLKKSYEIDPSTTDDNIVRCPDAETAAKMIAYIEELKKSGDSTGGIIQCVVSGMPTGLGEPVFDKLHADLGKAMLSINAVHGFEYGSGFNSASMHGSEHNDQYFMDRTGTVVTTTNHSGGIQGGISNGMDIYFNVAFKPVATILQKQNTVNKSGENVEMQAAGRHDPCVVPRAVPIVEAMTALVLADHLLRHRLSKLENINETKTHR
jgi:chorismate synthase